MGQSTDSGIHGFARRGFYLHACWEFNYPFAVRRWDRDDYRKTFGFLRRLGFDTVMLWPTSEAVPPPMSEADAADLRGFRPTIEDAKAAGLETWLVQCANLTSRPEIADRPLFERHLYPFKVAVRLDDEAERTAYFRHREQIISILNNADAYVTIDGDPGGYPEARPEEFLRVFLADRATLDRVGVDPKRQKLIPWIWSGWGSDWEKHGVWRQPLEPLTRPLLDLLKREMPEPWELLPGRSFADDWANGRTNLALTEEAGLIERSMLLTYEIVEFEPTPPAVVIQFEAIRRVLRQEGRYAGTARGVMANAQQPIMAIPNLFLFARGSGVLSYLEKSDEAILRDLAEALGGPPDLLLPAWQCLTLPLAKLPTNLSARLRGAELTSELAALLPGGPRRYLHILADFVDVRRQVLAACDDVADSGDRRSDDVIAQAVFRAIAALVAWWNTHRYVVDGTQGEGFRLGYTHSQLLHPLQELVNRSRERGPALAPRIVRHLVDERVLADDEAKRTVDGLFGIPARS